MNIFEDFVKELNQVKLYDVTEGDKTFKTIRCDLVCDILSTLLAKYDIERINDDLHG